MSHLIDLNEFVSFEESVPFINSPGWQFNEYANWDADSSIYVEPFGVRVRIPVWYLLEDQTIVPGIFVQHLNKEISEWYSRRVYRVRQALMEDCKNHKSYKPLMNTFNASSTSYIKYTDPEQMFNTILSKVNIKASTWYQTVYYPKGYKNSPVVDVWRTGHWGRTWRRKNYPVGWAYRGLVGLPNTVETTKASLKPAIRYSLNKTDKNVIHTEKVFVTSNN